MVGIDFASVFNGGKELVGCIVIGFLCEFQFFFLSFGPSHIFSYLIKMSLARIFRFEKIFAYRRVGEVWPRLEKSFLNGMEKSGIDGAPSCGMKILNQFWNFLRLVCIMTL